MQVIPGIEDQSIEDLVWQGTRLFSAGLDGHIREIDLVKLNTKVGKYIQYFTWREKKLFLPYINPYPSGTKV